MKKAAHSLILANLFIASSFTAAAAIERLEAEGSSSASTAAIEAEDSAQAQKTNLRLEIKPETAKQGQTVEVLLSSQGKLDSSIYIEFLGKKVKAFPLESDSGAMKYRALVVAPATQAPGTYKIKCAEIEMPLKIIDAKFGIQSMRLPKGKDTFAASPGEEEAVNKAKATVTDRKYWQGKFLLPSKARTSTAYGLRRRVNGKLLQDYFHSGLDFAGAMGSEVLASQSGRVLLARSGWRLHGNTICIDHGQGVLSFYIHLSKILVKEGEIVKAGSKIGAIGSSGRANGPHLHFSIYVNKDAANPSDWFTRSF